jgi:hypothetical protein
MTEFEGIAAVPLGDLKDSNAAETDTQIRR